MPDEPVIRLLITRLRSGMQGCVAAIAGLVDSSAMFVEPFHQWQIPPSADQLKGRIAMARLVDVHPVLFDQQTGNIH